MSGTKKVLLWIVASLVGAVIIAFVIALVAVQSDWFKDNVRRRMVAIFEDTTGGRVEIGKFSYDWRNLTAEVSPFVLHGKEPATAPPLFRADKIQIGLKIISALKKEIDIARLSIAAPALHITVAPDGSTNLPTPKVVRSNRTVIQQLLDLKVRRFDLHDGYLDYNEQRIPLDLQAENLKTDLRYDPTGPRYAGEISSRQVRAAYPKFRDVVVFGIAANGALENNRLHIASARVNMSESTADLAGDIHDFASPIGDFNLTAHLFPKDLSQALRLPIAERGAVDFNGKASFSILPLSYKLDGKVKARGIDYSNQSARLTGIGLVSNLEISPARIALPNAEVSLLNGKFHGAVTILDWRRFDVRGEARDFPIQELARVSGQHVAELNGAATGPVHAEGILTKQGIDRLKFDAKLAIAPGETGVPLRGSVDLNYDQRAARIALGESHLTIGSTQLDVSGALGESLSIHAVSRNLNDILAASPLLGKQPPKELPVQLKGGSAQFDGFVTGPLSDPRIAGNLAATRFRVGGRDFDRITTTVDLTKSSLEFRNLALDQGSLHAQGNGRIGLRDWNPEDGSPISTVLTIRGIDIAKLLAESGPLAKVTITGTASAALNLKGTLGSPEGNALLQAADVVAYGEKFSAVRAALIYGGHTLDLVSGDITAAAGHLTAAGSYNHSGDDWKTGRLRFNVSGNGLGLAQMNHVRDFNGSLTGQLDVKANGTANLVKGEFDLTSLNNEAKFHDLAIDGRPYGQLVLTANTNGSVLDAKVAADVRGTTLMGSGEWRLVDDYPGQAQIEIPRLTVATIHDLAPGQHVREQLPFEGFIEGSINISGPLRKPDSMRADVVLNKAQINAYPTTQPLAGAQAKDLVLHNSKPVVLEASTKAIDIKSAEFEAKDTTLQVSGRFSFDAKTQWDLSLNGNVNLTILQIFNPDLLGSGNSIIKATVRGSFTEPQVDGRLEFKNASLFLKDVPNGVDQANGVILFDRNRASVQNLTALTGGGRITFQPGSFVGFRGLALIYRLQAEAAGVRYRSPDGISITVNALLNLIGTSENSVLSGTVTVERAGFNPRTDVGGLLASTAKPISSPVTSNEYLRGIQFDLRVLGSQTLAIQTSLTRDVQAEANVRIRGTIEKPVVLGNITVNSGEIEFFGNKYTINHGEVNFFNPAKIDPILNMDLETRVRGITVDISFSGPLNKLSFSYRSDPPLETNQIVALLAVGRVPTTTGGLASSQSVTNTSYLATGSNALLSQAISPTTGRLQRFFGVSHIKIDPQFSDLTTIPQARLTLEQQVSKDVTLTYITNLTRTQEQIVRVEWDLSRHWSVVALRDENGVFGIDFQYRKRFK